MANSPCLKTQEHMTPSTSLFRESSGATEMNDPDSTTTTVANFIELLHAKMSSPHEKELITQRLLAIARERKDARTLIGSHAQALPLFVSILRNGTSVAKVNVSSILSVMCKDEELRLKVLLGGCIPPLLSLLKSEAIDARKAAAEVIYEVSSGGLSEDHVGTKIFITEGVVPTLWNQLDPKIKQDSVVEGFVTGALRNLSDDSAGYGRATLEAGAIDIIVGLLYSDNAATQSNAASLLARSVLAFCHCIPKVIESGAVKALLQLVNKEDDISVRASAADALEALSSKSSGAKKAVVDANGIPILIGAVVAPSKECMPGECGQLLQRHATQALAYICGGMSSLILYLGELSQSPRLGSPVADIVGALAYVLMVFEHQSSDNEEPSKLSQTENILVNLLKPHDNKLIQERVFEAMASLYSNVHLSRWLDHAEAKKVLVGLIEMAYSDVQEQLILSLTTLCHDRVGIWEAIGKREGIQLPISLLVLSSEQQREYAVRLLAILTDHVDDSKWAITAAGGIPPLVQLLETGSQKAREEAAHVLWNLCSHNQDIRACVESAGAIPAFLWLLRSGGTKGQKASALALTKLVRSADSATINQLLALLLGDSPSSKSHIIKVLGHVLLVASYQDLVLQGSAANMALKSLVQVLDSSNEETQEYAASVVADLFSCRDDVSDTLANDEFLIPCMKLLASNSEVVAKQSARAVGAISRSTKINNKISYVAKKGIKPLVLMAKTSSVDAAEAAVSALANIISDTEIAAEALSEDVVLALTKILVEGTPEGKKNAACALHGLLKHFSVIEVLQEDARYHFAVHALVDSLSVMDMNGTDAEDVLEVLDILGGTKHEMNSAYSLWPGFAEVPFNLEPLVYCLADGPPSVQDKAIRILSRISADQPVTLGDILMKTYRSVGSLATRVTSSPSIEVRIGGTVLLICAAKEHEEPTLGVIDKTGLLEPLVYALVDMANKLGSCSSSEIEVRTPKSLIEMTARYECEESDFLDAAILSGRTVAFWMLSIICSFHCRYKLTVVEAGGLETLSKALSTYISSSPTEVDDANGIWICALLLAILFQNENVVSSPGTVKIIPSIALLLRSDKFVDRFFAAQAMASLVCNGREGIDLDIANSGAVAGLINLLGYVESDMPNLIALAQKLSLSQNPEEVVLEHLFGVKDIRVGSVARKSIPLLVDLLRPNPERPGAPQVAIRLLTHIADETDSHKIIMAEAGALDALTKYLSLSPQDSTEASIVELLRILFSHPELIQYEASASSLNQLIAVLRLGSRSARYSAARALHELFDAENLRESELARQAVQPLIDMLNAASEREQEAAVIALAKLTLGDSSKVSILTDVKGNPLESLYRILSSSSSPELKKSAAQLCYVLFGHTEGRQNPIASEFLEPLISLMQSDRNTIVESGVCAFERLLDDEQQVELAAGYELVDILIGLVHGSNFRLVEASISSLIKLGRDRSQSKMEMVKAGIINNCLELLPHAPVSLCVSIAELFHILTNSNAIAQSPEAAFIVEPLFMVLSRPDFSLWGQHSALQALVNILEKPQSLETLQLNPSQVIEPLITFLESPSVAIQQVSTELLSHLLAQDHFQKDITTKNAVVPLVQLAGIGILNLQQTAIKALEKLSISWPKAVADAGGVSELAKVIIQNDPQPPLALWESAASVLSSILHSKVEFYCKVPVVVLVKMLQSTLESTIKVALDALYVHERSDKSSAEQMIEGGAIDALLSLLRSHQCEQASGRLLEALFNNARVREMKVSKYAIAPLSQYLLDPETRSQSGKLLAALALGDLSQHERLARSRDSVSACHALISLIEDQPTEEMKVVAICALQNFVMNSRTNRRAVAEVGGVLVIQDLLLSPNSEVAMQAALLIKFLFSNHTLQEYASSELVRSLTAALQSEMLSDTRINEEVLRTLYVVFSNFAKLHTSEAATLCLSHLINVLTYGGGAAQEAVLDILCLLQQSWATMSIDIAQSQAMVAAQAIPLLQSLTKTGPPNFHERVGSLLHCLPGSLTVTIKRGNNLKQAMGSTNAFCMLMIGNTAPRQTKVVRGTSPVWGEGFTWAFDVPPKGQKLHIICKSKNTFGKSTLGRVTIQIEKVVTEGVYSGLFDLSHESNKDGSSRTLEIEIIWSMRIPSDSI